MGRKRLKKVSELNPRDMECKCGRLVHVVDDDITEVTCTFCLNKCVPLSRLTPEALEAYDNEMLQKEQQKEVQAAKPKLSKNGKRLGRPPKKIKSIESADSYLSRKKVEKRMDVNENVTPVKDTVVIRDRKTSKGTKMTQTKTKGKRGRKPTVGAKVLQFINAQPGKVMFEEILGVYTAERERLGKKDPDPKIEERNCRSTLYIMKRDGKICEVEEKKVYSKVGEESDQA